MPAPVRRAPPGLLDRLAGGEQRAHPPVGADVGLGEHRSSAGLQEPGGVVVDPLVGHRHRRLGVVRLRVARGVAEVIEDDDRVRRQADVGRDVRLAVVLGVVVALAGGGVEPEPVLAVRHRGSCDTGSGSRCRGRGRATTDGALERRLHGRPGRVRAVDLDHVRRVLGRLGSRHVGPAPVARTWRQCVAPTMITTFGPLEAAARRGGSRGRRQADDDEQGEGEAGGAVTQSRLRWAPGMDPIPGRAGGRVCRQSLGVDPGRLNRGKVPERRRPIVPTCEGGGRSRAVGGGGASHRRCPGAPRWRRRSGAQARHAARSATDSSGRGPTGSAAPSGVPGTGGHGTAATGSSQANPSSSEPSYSLVTR